MQKINWYACAACSLVSTLAMSDTNVSSIKACNASDTGMGKYMTTITPPNPKLIDGLKCKAPSTYVEIVTALGKPTHFCTAAKGLIPAPAGKGYRIDMASYFTDRIITKVSARAGDIETTLAVDHAALSSLFASWKDAHIADGTLSSGAVFALANSIPAEYHRDKSGKHLSMMDTLANYRLTLQQEIDKLTAEKENYTHRKVADQIESAANDFATLAQFVLADCPSAGSFSNPVYGCHTDGGETPKDSTADSFADSFAGELEIFKDQDDKRKGTPFEGLGIEGLFQQASLTAGAGPQENFLACNELLQSFGVTRFGCKSEKSGASDCRIVADGAAALDPAKVVGGQALNDSLFGNLPDTSAPEGTFLANLKKGGDPAPATVVSTWGVASAGAASTDSSPR